MKDCQKSSIGVEEKANVSYPSVVGCLMYAMVYNRTNISRVEGVLILYIANHG